MRRTTVWILSILVGACAVAVLPLPAPFVERWYSGGLYPPLQRTLTTVSNLVPFALLDVLLLLPIVWIAVAVRAVRRSAHRARALACWGMYTAGASAALYLLFLVTGFCPGFLCLLYVAAAIL